MADNIEGLLQQPLQELIKCIYDSKEFSDCEFIVGKDKVHFKGHKLVMSAFSPVFRTMFDEKWKTSEGAEKSEPITIVDIEPVGFTTMLECLYFKNIDFKSLKHTLQTLKAAKKYIIPQLEILCQDYVQTYLNSSTVFDTYRISAQHYMDDISKMCIKYCRNDATVLKNEKFFNSNLDFIESLVEENELRIGSEVELFEAVEKWAIKDSEAKDVNLQDVLPQLNDVISNIRFQTMSLEDLASTVVKSPLLSGEEKCSLIMNKVKPGLLPYPKRFSSCTDNRTSATVGRAWRLKRTWKNKLTLYFASNSIDFLRKYISVSRPITLVGLVIHVYNNMYVKVVQETSTGGVWNVEKAAESRDFFFTEPVHLIPGQTYYIEIYKKCTNSSPITVTYLNDLFTTYKQNDIILTMSDDYSQIEEFIFKEL